MLLLLLSLLLLLLLFTVTVTVAATVTVTVTVFKFNACTYHTVQHPPVHVALTNVPMPIVVILLFDSSLQMQSYVCSRLFCFIVWLTS